MKHDVLNLWHVFNKILVCNSDFLKYEVHFAAYHMLSVAVLVDKIKKLFQLIQLYWIFSRLSRAFAQMDSQKELAKWRWVMLACLYIVLYFILTFLVICLCRGGILSYRDIYL
jgi:hypothetical protein